MEPGYAAQNGGVLLALAVAALFKKVGEQVIDDLANVGAVRAAGQKDPVLRRQRRAVLQNGVLLRGKFRQLRRMGGRIRHFLIFCAAQRIDLCIQRFQLLQNLFDQLRFLPWVWSCRMRSSVSFILSRGTT